MSSSKSCSSAMAPAACAATGPAAPHPVARSARVSTAAAGPHAGIELPGQRYDIYEVHPQEIPSFFGSGSITIAPAPSDSVKRRKSASARAPALGVHQRRALVEGRLEPARRKFAGARRGNLVLACAHVQECGLRRHQRRTAHRLEARDLHLLVAPARHAPRSHGPARDSPPCVVAVARKLRSRISSRASSSAALTALALISALVSKPQPVASSA